MDLNLNNREWKTFAINHIFDISTGANVPNKYLGEGNIPRISATEKHNGIAISTNQSSHKNFRLVTNFISLSFLGAVFYHPYTASLDMKIHAIKLKNYKLNKNLSLFFLLLLRRNFCNTLYGNQLSSTDLPYKKILLPIDFEGNPDFEFMENYIKQKEQDKLKHYKNYINEKINELQHYKEVEKLKDKNWKEFNLKDIFIETHRGKRLIKSNHIQGDIPYLSSTALNNGIDGFVGNKKNVRFFSNCLTVANSGSVGACFYHPYNFIASDHVTHLKNDELNSYTYKFISFLIKRFEVKYSFNREISDFRINREKILLPINYKNEPDYEYMENYIKQLEYRKLKQYLNSQKRNSK